MVTQKLAESIIIQSLEDLWDAQHRAESLKFFSSHNFRTCAKAAGMGLEEKLKLLTFVKKIIDTHKKPVGKMEDFTYFSRLTKPKAINF